MLGVLWIFVPYYACWNFEDRDVSGKDGGLFMFIVAGSGLLGLTAHSSGGFFMCASSFLPPVGLVREDSMQEFLS